MMAKPMKTLELHYPMIQFLIMQYIRKKKDSLNKFYQEIHNIIIIYFISTGQLYFTLMKTLERVEI